jgi:Transposase DDE domain/Transposase domain (DUF772)
MQGRTRLDRELLDAEMIAGRLVPAGSVFAFLAEHRTELFPASFTADLFPSRTGRPSLPPDLVGAVLVLKELYDLSDAQAADALKFDIRWKAACGRSLTEVSFDPSVLVYWRRRIAGSQRPDRVFDAVAEVIAQTGILRGRRKRCVDSTVFDDAVATQDTVTQLVAAIRKVARVVPGAGGVIGRVCTLDYSKPGKPAIDWDDPEAKKSLVSDLVNDALAVLAELAGPGAPERDGAAADALGLLALVAGQDVEPAEDSDGTGGRWRIARKVAPDRVISTCPAGVTRPMSRTRCVTFGVACAGCPLRQRCTTAQNGRSMTIHPHEGLLRAARAQARTEAFKKAYPTRAAIERIIAWTATQNGHRIKLRYIGATRNDAWLHTRCAALNLRTLLKAGLTRRDGAWALT